jgi:outer membrane lipoprotein-sorting protein
MIAICGAACAVEFSADVVEKSGGATATGKFFQQGVKIRQDMARRNAIQTKLSRPDKGMLWIMDTVSKQYDEYPIPKLDKLEAPKWGLLSKRDPNIKHLGTEKINGYLCDKYRISLDTKKKKLGYALRWVSAKLGCEIKTEQYSADGLHSTEFKNIKERKLPGSTFELPAGYTLRKGSPMPSKPSERLGKKHS